MVSYTYKVFFIKTTSHNSNIVKFSFYRRSQHLDIIPTDFNDAKIILMQPCRQMRFLKVDKIFFGKTTRREKLPTHLRTSHTYTTVCTVQ